MEVARRGIEELQKHVDSLIVIPNEKLQLVLPEDMTVTECHKKADEVLMNAVQGISGLITNPGEINVDFADVQTVMSNRGMAMMGLGTASGEGRAERAVEAALSCPLLDDIELNGARGILVTLTHGGSLTRKELQLVNERVSTIGSDDADMKFGVSIDPAMGDELRVTVVATGLTMRPAAALQPAVHASPKVAPFVRPDTSSVPTLTGVPQRSRAEPTMGGIGGSAATAAKPMPSYLQSLDYNEDLLDIPTFLRQQAD
jgi:cell division protein FtsZ